MSLTQEPLGTYNQLNLSFSNYAKKRKLEPLVKWAGGKERELKYIIPAMPRHFVNYYEPFVGGGAVYTAIQSENYFINDKSHELIDLYKIIVSNQRELFFRAVDQIIRNWKLLGAIVQENRAFLTEIYKSFSRDKLSKDSLENIIEEFVMKNSPRLSELFSPYYNFNIKNFLREIKRNLLRKKK